MLGLLEGSVRHLSAPRFGRIFRRTHCMRESQFDDCLCGSLISMVKSTDLWNPNDSF
jgi:hypothetical protein